MNSNEYECAMCHNVYTKAWTEEEARAETESYWPGLIQEDMAVVCDDCWQKIHPEEHPIQYLDSLAEMGTPIPVSLVPLTMQDIIEMFRIPPALMGEIDSTNLHGHECRETAYRKRFGL